MRPRGEFKQKIKLRHKNIKSIRLLRILLQVNYFLESHRKTRFTGLIYNVVDHNVVVHTERSLASLHIFEGDVFRAKFAF